MTKEQYKEAQQLMEAINRINNVISSYENGYQQSINYERFDTDFLIEDFLPGMVQYCRSKKAEYEQRLEEI